MKKWLLLLCFVPLLHASVSEPWTWKDGNGVTRTREDLDAILREHKNWVISHGTQGKRADLSKARLEKVNLSGAYLSGANCDGADFIYADLRETDFSDAQLTGANFYRVTAEHISLKRANLKRATFWQANLREAMIDGADLTQGYLVDADLTQASLQRTKLVGAQFGQLLNDQTLSEIESNPEHAMPGDISGARLTKAQLTDADLTDSVLIDAKLTDAVLTDANLRGANLLNADLRGTDLRNAELSGAIYEPTYGSTASGIALAKGLDHLESRGNPTQVYLIRKSLLDAGFLQQAKLVTAAIHRHDESKLERFMFDWTCAWGSNWLRPLEIIGCLCLFCALIYWAGMRFGKKDGLYVVSTGQRVITNGSKEHLHRISVIHLRRLPKAERAMLGSHPATLRRTRIRSFVTIFKAETAAFGTATVFSLLTVFNIGFHDFNFGRWIRLLQPRDYDIRARGWLRTVSGIQSLLGLFLLALCLLSYFGHPFE